MRTLAVLPVKSFGLAKQRLGEAVGADDRRALARAMAGDVLEALGRVEALEGVILVSAEQLEAGDCPSVVHDPIEIGQSAAALPRRLGRRWSGERSGSCSSRATAPRSSRPRSRSCSRSRVPGGLRPPLPPRRGHERAADRTARRRSEPAFGPVRSPATRRSPYSAGARVRIGRLPSLELDVDTPGDLAALRAALAARAGGAPRTRALLDGIASAHAA